MRKRFRGNRPITMSQELEADASGKSYQLYAGAPAFAGTKGTSGNEKEDMLPEDEFEESVRR